MEMFTQKLNLQLCENIVFSLPSQYNNRKSQMYTIACLYIVNKSVCIKEQTITN